MVDIGDASTASLQSGPPGWRGMPPWTLKIEESMMAARGIWRKALLIACQGPPTCNHRYVGRLAGWSVLIVGMRWEQG